MCEKEGMWKELLEAGQIGNNVKSGFMEVPGGWLLRTIVSTHSGNPVCEIIFVSRPDGCLTFGVKWEALPDKGVGQEETYVRSDRISVPDGWIVRVVIWRDGAGADVKFIRVHDLHHEWRLG